MIVMLEILLFFFKKAIMGKQQLIDYVKCAIVCFYLTIYPGIKFK